MIRVTFDHDEPDELDDCDAWQPDLFGGPGASSLLRQRPLFPGGMDRGPAPSIPPRGDQPGLFPE